MQEKVNPQHAMPLVPVKGPEDRMIRQRSPPEMREGGDELQVPFHRLFKISHLLRTGGFGRHHIMLHVEIRIRLRSLSGSEENLGGNSPIYNRVVLKNLKQGPAAHLLINPDHRGHGYGPGATGLPEVPAKSHGSIRFPTDEAVGSGAGRQRELQRDQFSEQ